MGIRIYYYMVLAVLVFGALMPQKGRQRKYYIALMAILHSFVCGFRYKYLTGDLIKYAAGYYNMEDLPWMSEGVLQGGRNLGFSLMNKLFSTITHGDFQILLIVIAVITEIAVAILVFKYSPRPWLSYFVWNCLSFYVFGFSALKQALAMGILMWAATGIFEKRFKRFLILTIIAGLIHMPALVFLPAYWIARRKVTVDALFIAVFAAVIIFFLRKQIVDLVSPLYYEDETFVLGESGLGMRFFFMVGLLAVGIIIKGFEERSFNYVFHLIAIATILQMFSGFDNIFTRMSDYYFQFSVLYIPMLLFQEKKESQEYEIEPYGGAALLRMNSKARTIAVVIAVALLMLYYYKTQLSATITYEVDNYLNFRFMWDVVQ